MANAGPCCTPGVSTSVFFPPGSPLSPSPPIPVPQMVGFSTVDPTLHCPSDPVIPSLPPAPPGVSFIIQIGLTRESVLMPQSADLAYVKQIACSIVDTKVRDAQTGEGGVSHVFPKWRKNEGQGPSPPWIPMVLGVLEFSEKAPFMRVNERRVKTCQELSHDCQGSKKTPLIRVLYFSTQRVLMILILLR